MQIQKPWPSLSKVIYFFSCCCLPVVIAKGPPDSKFLSPSHPIVLESKPKSDHCILFEEKITLYFFLPFSTFFSVAPLIFHSTLSILNNISSSLSGKPEKIHCIVLCNWRTDGFLQTSLARWHLHISIDRLDLLQLFLYSREDLLLVTALESVKYLPALFQKFNRAEVEGNQFKSVG